jgi:hypothetical protein
MNLPGTNFGVEFFNARHIRSECNFRMQFRGRRVQRPGPVGWSASSWCGACVYFVNGGRRLCREPFSYQSDRTSTRLRSARRSNSNPRGIFVKLAIARRLHVCNLCEAVSLCVRSGSTVFGREFQRRDQDDFIVTQLQGIAAMRLGSRCLRPSHRPIRLRSRQRTIGNLAV